MAAVSTARKIVATSLSTNFRSACEIVKANVSPLGANDVLIKTKYAGVNATDVNVSAGRYATGNSKEALPMGLEGLGIVIDRGENVPRDVIGRSAGYVWGGSFADYIKLPYQEALLCDQADIHNVPLLISGLTASISLEKFGDLHKGDTVFVSAAAGGTGHIAVQLAKAAGCHVIASCSTDEKSAFLKRIGCDRVINYFSQNLNEVLKAEYPRGLDVVYESIGGNVFDTCINRLGVRGRMILIGYISSYHLPGGVDKSLKNATLPTKLLMKSASINGFFLMHYKEHYQRHWTKLLEMVNNGQLMTHTETQSDDGLKFNSLDSVFDAVEYLYSRKSCGKVCVNLDSATSTTTSKL